MEEVELLREVIDKLKEKKEELDEIYYNSKDKEEGLEYKINILDEYIVGYIKTDMKVHKLKEVYGDIPIRIKKRKYNKVKLYIWLIHIMIVIIGIVIYFKG